MGSDPDPYRHVNQAREELSCDEHDPTLFVSGGNYGRCCSRCGERLQEGWIPHDELTDSEMAQAIDNRGEIESAHSEEIKQRATELRRQDAIPDFDELCPEQDAPSTEWRSAFETVKSINSLPSEERNDLFWSLYEKYLWSSSWSKTRKRLIKEKGDECAAKLSGCEESADHIHHTSYEHIGTEPMWELMPVCHACHEVLHQEYNSDSEPEEDE